MKLKNSTCAVLSCFSHVWLFATLWTTAQEAPLSLRFFRQKYWSGLPCPPAGDLPNPGIKPSSLMSLALSGRFFNTSATWEAPKNSMLLLLLSRLSRVRLCTTHRRQPTRLPCPWDSPGKNTGVGCHFLLQCMKVKSESEVAQSCPTLSDPMDSAF